MLRRNCQVTWVSVMSPLPPGRMAMSIGLPRRNDMIARNSSRVQKPFLSLSTQANIPSSRPSRFASFSGSGIP